MDVITSSYSVRFLREPSPSHLRRKTLLFLFSHPAVIYLLSSGRHCWWSIASVTVAILQQRSHMDNPPTHTHTSKSCIRSFLKASTDPLIFAFSLLSPVLRSGDWPRFDLFHVLIRHHLSFSVKRPSIGDERLERSFVRSRWQDHWYPWCICVH